MLIWRCVVAVLFAIAAVALGGPPWLSMSVILAMLTVIAIVEQRGATRMCAADAEL